MRRNMTDHNNADIVPGRGVLLSCENPPSILWGSGQTLDATLVLQMIDAAASEQDLADAVWTLVVKT